MTQPTTTIAPTVGAHVVITAGPPYEMTWDDRDRGLGFEGVLVAVDPACPAPYEVRTADGVTLQAAKVRVVDGAYRAWQEQHRTDILARRVELLEEKVRYYAASEAMPFDLRSYLLGAVEEAAMGAWAEHYTG